MTATHHRTHLFHSLLALFSLAVVFACTANAEQWTGKLNKTQQAFCDKHMPAALALRKTQGNEAALAEIERIYQLAERNFNDSYFFAKVVWYEAQVKGGMKDEQWGLEVYEYIWDRDFRTKPENELRLRPSMYNLLDNIIEKKRSLGRAASARADSLRMAEYLREQKGMDTISPEKYEDTGTILNFSPLPRNRNFPIYEHQLPSHLQSPITNTKIDFIEYSYLFSLNKVADSALSVGDWIKAAELSAWGINYTDEYMRKNRIHGDVGRYVGYASYNRLAELSLLHGYPEEAARLLEEFLEKAQGFYRMNYTSQPQAKLKLCLIDIAAGKLDSTALTLADKAVKRLAGIKFFERANLTRAYLDRARIYHAMGHEKEAWDMVDEMLEEAATDVNPHMEVIVMNGAIDLAMADGATHPHLEKWLLRVLSYERQMGHKFKELPLYEKYAQFLMIHGWFDEAIQIQSEAVRLSQAMSLPKRLEDNKIVLANIITARSNAMAKNEPASQQTETANDKANTTPAEQEEETSATGYSMRPVDIQPRSSLSVALPGQAALGRFYLHNPSAYAQIGELVLCGPINQPEWQTEQWFTSSSSPTFETVDLSKELVLQPGESRIIDIHGLTDGKGGAKIECRWVSEKQPTVSGLWEYQHSTTQKRSAVIDAHVVQSNPFYLIPIHHMIQRRDAGSAETIDFKIQSTHRMRIEAYAARSGKLLATDANGDGDFMDIGDFIASDENRNSWPDIAFSENQSAVSLVLYVKPLEPNAHGDEELTVLLLQNNEWRTDAVDVIQTVQ
jgi:hypothetical protein